MDDYISRSEHEEFRRSMDLANKNLADENNRQNKRLDILEENSKQITALVTNVERLAVNMENSLKIQESHAKRLEVIESRDGKMWRKVVEHIVTAIAGAVTCYILMKMGIS